MADDVGLLDLVCKASEIKTLNFEKLANKGLRFSKCCSAAKHRPSKV